LDDDEPKRLPIPPARGAARGLSEERESFAPNWITQIMANHMAFPHDFQKRLMLRQH
jgi:hypothetical protein